MNIRNNILFGTIVILLSCSNSTTNENSQIMSAIYKICPKADVVNVEHKVESMELEFMCNDEPISIVFDQQGNVLYKESPLPNPQEFIQKVEKKIQKTHSGWLLDEISLIETPDTSFVKIEIIKNGIEENLFFSLNGKFYKNRNYQATEIWTTNFLQKSNYYKTLQYDFLNPKEIFDVPEILKEISGISIVGDTAIFCIQDELGVVFQIDIKSKSLATVGRFTDIGDFEDVQAVDDEVYILRSDGNIFSFNYEKYNGKVEQTMLNVPCMNMEGIYFDKAEKQFLVSCKEPPMEFRAATKKQHRRNLIENADKERIIYSFNKNTNFSPETFLSINIEDIRQFIKDKYLIDSTQTITFNPSAIAINPITKDVYILSAADRMITIYEQKVLKNIILLSPDDFYKPEGIDFLSNGDMVISSEGMKKGSLQGQITIIEMKKGE